MKLSLLKWRLILILPALLMLNSCAMFHYDTQLVQAVPPSGTPSPTLSPAPAGSHRVVWLLGGISLDEQVAPVKGVSHVHLAKDWFEDLVTLATLGIVNPMEVRYDTAPGAVSPFGMDVPGKGPRTDLSKFSREGWLLFGLIPIDGGIQVNTCPGCEVRDFKVTRELKADDVGNFVKNFLTIFTFGLVTPVDLHWEADTPVPVEGGTMPPPPHHKPSSSNKHGKTKRSHP